MGDIKDLVDAVQRARSLGYRRVILTGQSAGAWQTIIAASRGAQADGVVVFSPGWYGKVDPKMDVTITRSEWSSYVNGIQPGGRYFIATFLKDPYDVGGLLEAAKPIFARHGVDAMLLNYPAGFEGHWASGTTKFITTFGRCLFRYIERGVKESPCVDL